MTTWWYAPHLDAGDRGEEINLPTREGANLQGSINADGKTHSIVLDLDGPHDYRPSATEGHAHLVIPAKLTRRQYAKLLRLLYFAGAITEGYFDHAAHRRWTTFVRAPGVFKQPGDASSDDRYAGGRVEIPTTSGSDFDYGIDDSIDGPEPYDPRCRRYAAQMPDLDAVRGDLSRQDFVRSEEGTYNPENGHFLCDECYIAAGMPSSPSGWVCP